MVSSRSEKRAETEGKREREAERQRHGESVERQQRGDDRTAERPLTVSGDHVRNIITTNSTAAAAAAAVSDWLTSDRSPCSSTVLEWSTSECAYCERSHLQCVLASCAAGQTSQRRSTRPLLFVEWNIDRWRSRIWWFFLRENVIGLVCLQ